MRSKSKKFSSAQVVASPKRIAIVCLFAIVGLMSAFYPVLWSLFQTGHSLSVPGDLGDTRLIVYLLEHSYRWLNGFSLHQSIWDPPMFYPAKNTFAYSDFLLSVAPFYWIWRMLGISELNSFLAFFWVLCLLNFSTFYWFLRRGFRFDSLPSALGSYLFAFGTTRLNHLSHPQFFGAFFTVLSLHSLVNIFKNPKREGKGYLILGLALGVIGQLYCSFYLGWFLLLAIAILFGVALSIRSAREVLVLFIRKNIIWILAIALFSLGLLFPLLIHYLSAAKQVGLRFLSQIFEPKLQSWFYMGGESLLYSWQDKVRAFQVISTQEQKIGTGFATLFLSISGLWMLRKQVYGKAVGITLIVLVMMTTSFFGMIYIWPAFFYWLPGAQAVRALSRVGVAVLPIFSIGLAAYFQNRKLNSILIFLTILITFEQFRRIPSFSITESEARIQKVVSQVPANCSYLFLMPREGDPEPILSQLDAMWVSFVRPTVYVINGYSGNVPPGWKGGDSRSDIRVWLKNWAKSNQLDWNKVCVVGPS